VFLNACFRENYKLPLQQCGMSQHYSAKDIKTQKQIRQLKKWLEDVCMEKDTNVKDRESWVIRDTWTGRLTNAYVDVLKDVVAHYKPCGLMTQFAEGYTDLDAALKGEKLSLDTLAEMAGPEPVPEKTTETAPEKK
jgi:hypothetical protein